MTSKTPLIKMERYMLQQSIDLIKFTVTVRKTNAFLSSREAPSRPTIVKLVKKIELLGQVSDVKNR